MLPTGYMGAVKPSAMNINHCHEATARPYNGRSYRPTSEEPIMGIGCSYQDAG